MKSNAIEFRNKTQIKYFHYGYCSREHSSPTYSIFVAWGKGTKQHKSGFVRSPEAANCFLLFLNQNPRDGSFLFVTVPDRDSGVSTRCNPPTPTRVPSIKNHVSQPWAEEEAQKTRPEKEGESMPPAQSLEPTDMGPKFVWFQAGS